MTGRYGSYKSIGFEFKATKAFEVDSLGRGIATTRALESTTVTLWGPDKQVLASAVVGPSSTVSSGYAFEKLDTPVALEAGAKYRISQNVRSGIRDGWSYSGGRSGRISKFQSTYVEYQGQRKSYNVGYPAGRLSSHYTDYTVTFKIRENQGCGRGRFTCHSSNHSCAQPPPSEAGFEVTKGNCETTESGSCVTSTNYPSSYANRDKCTITASAMKLNVVDFETESPFDKLTVEGKRYSGSGKSRGPQDVAVKEGSTLNWQSDGSVVRKGWKICNANVAR